MKMLYVLVVFVFAITLQGCDWHCTKEHIFTFSYPNELSQSEFNFDVDYSEIPESDTWVDVDYFLSVSNCSDKGELTIEIYTQFGSENEYRLDEKYKLLPSESNTYEGGLLYREATGELLDSYKERNVHILLKGLNSSCYNGEMNVKTIFPWGGISTRKYCPYGYE